METANPSIEPTHSGLRPPRAAPPSYAALEAVIQTAIGRTYEWGFYGLAWCLDEYPTPVTITVVDLHELRVRSPYHAKMLEIALREVAERRSGQGFVANVA